MKVKDIGESSSEMDVYRAKKIMRDTGEGER